MNVKSTAALLLFLIIALLLRLGVWLHHDINPEHFIRPDSHSYLSLGAELMEQGTFSDFFRTPVYPLFLGILINKVKTTVSYVVLLQILLSLSTVFLVYKFTKFISNKICALIACFFLATDAISVFSCNLILSETIFTFVLVLLVNLFLVFFIKNKINNQVILFLASGFSFLSLIRSIAIFIPFFIFLWMLISYHSHTYKKIFIITLFILISSFLPLVWTVKNYAATGQFFFIKSNLLEYRAVWNLSVQTGKPFYEVQRRWEFEQKEWMKTNKKNYFDMLSFYKEKAFVLLLNSPALTIRQAGEGFVKLYFGILNSEINKMFYSEQTSSFEYFNLTYLQNYTHKIKKKKILHILSIAFIVIHLILLYFGILLLFLKFKNFTYNKYIVLFILLIIFSLSFPAFGAEASGRFRVPLSPLLVIISGMGWGNMVHLNKNKYLRSSI